MSRLPYAATTLISQVEAAKPKAKVEPFGDPDGLNVHRTLKFDKATSKWLAPLLDEIGDDRIEESTLTDSGYLHVTFVSTRGADTRDPFPLDAATEVTGTSE